MSEVLTSAVRRVGQALSGLLSLARVRSSRAQSGEHVAVVTEGLYDDRTEVWQSYGVQSRPKPDSIAVQAQIGSRPESLVTILVHDRRYTIQLAEGEVALVDDLGQKVHLTRSGIVVVADVVTVDSPDVRLGAGPTYRKPVCVGDTITGLTSPSGAVTGVIATADPGAQHVGVS